MNVFNEVSVNVAKTAVLLRNSVNDLGHVCPGPPTLRESSFLPAHAMLRVLRAAVLCVSDEWTFHFI